MVPDVGTELKEVCPLSFSHRSREEKQASDIEEKIVSKYVETSLCLMMCCSCLEDNSGGSLNLAGY